MLDRQSILDTIASSLAPVHPDGYKFLAIGAGLTLLLFWLWAPLGWIAAILTAWIAYFFRDPQRVTPVREGLIVAPADGRIVSLRQTLPPKELELGEEPMTCISIFLSIFDVHINRAPVSGAIIRKFYAPGLFLNAAMDKASTDNERQALVFQTAAGARIGVVQIAGLLARRIVTFGREGQQMQAGERFGLIRFGSRVDVYVPAGWGILAAEGQYAIAGETVLADLRSQETGREVRVS